MDKPQTQREIKKQQKSKAEEPRATVTNMTKGTIILQVRDKNHDFYVGERSIFIREGGSYTDRVSMFNGDQLHNLKARGDIRIIGSINV